MAGTPCWSTSTRRGAASAARSRRSSSSCRRGPAARPKQDPLGMLHARQAFMATASVGMPCRSRTSAMGLLCSNVHEHADSVVALVSDLCPPPSTPSALLACAGEAPRRQRHQGQHRGPGNEERGRGARQSAADLQVLQGAHAPQHAPCRAGAATARAQQRAPRALCRTAWSLRMRSPGTRRRRSRRASSSCSPPRGPRGEPSAWR